MNKEIELLIKIQGKLNKRRYHLYTETDLEEKYRFLLFIKFDDNRDYFSTNNLPLLSSNEGDTVNDLKEYLERHNGFDGRW